MRGHDRSTPRVSVPDELAAFDTQASWMNRASTMRAAMHDAVADAHADARTLHALFGMKETSVELGRFEMIAELGRGGFGVVYLAFDPVLRRRVALKVLATAAGQPSDDLLVEARALARLEHRNVVTIFDAFVTDGGQTVIAMELVKGGSLQQWLDESDGPRPWRAVVERFADAARGMQAAHAAGIVHRDFKPANVLVSEAGEVRVADFGLAAITAATEQGVGPALVGTPAYMPPEALLGDPVGAPGDVYAFCVALYKALCRGRPFAAPNLRAMAAVKSLGSLSLPSAVRAPGWLRRMVEAGTAPDPKQRPTFSELVRCFERRNERRWRLPAILAVGLAASPWIGEGRDPGPDCASVASQVDGVWNARARERVSAWLDRAEQPASTHSMLHALDDYAAQWRPARSAACGDGQVGPPDDRALANRRAACLDGSLAAMATIIETVDSVDPSRVRALADVVAELSGKASCRDPARVEHLSLPADPELAVAVTFARLELRRATSRLRVSAGLEHERRLVSLGDEAAVNEYAPLRAQWGIAVARYARETQTLAQRLEHVRQAALLAEAEGMHGLMFEALLSSANLGTFTREVGQADNDLLRAERIASRMNVSPRDRAELLLTRGRVRAAQGQSEAAIVAYRQAMDVAEPLGRLAVDARILLAERYLAIGRHDAALEHATAGGRVDASLMGTPQGLAVASILVRGLLEAGDLRRAGTVAAQVTRALRSHGTPPIQNTAVLLHELGLVARERGELDRAEALFSEGAELRRRLGTNGSGATESMLAIVKRERGRPGDALVLHREVLALRMRHLPPESIRINYARDEIAEDLRQLGRCDAAFELVAQTIAAYEGAADHGSLVDPLVTRGRCELAQGRRDEALSTLRRAVFEAESSPPGGVRQRGLTHAQQALAEAEA